MSNSLRYRSIAALALACASISWTGCTDVDDTLGFELLPGNKQMSFHTANLDGISTYMALSDSMPTNKLNRYFLGRFESDGYGSTSSGAVLQFLPAYNAFPRESETYYGYKPHVDSVGLAMYIADIDGDVSVPQKFYIYPLTEVIEFDSTYYGTFPAEEAADMSTPLFSFVMHNEVRGTTVKRLTVEPAGTEYLEKLIAVDNKVYESGSTDGNEAFRELFKGFYITRSSDPQEAPEKAAFYDLAPLARLNDAADYEDVNYFVVYAHNHKAGTTPPPNDVVHDPKSCGIADTLAVKYTFDDNGWMSYLPNVDISTIRHDYSSFPDAPSALIDPATFITPGTLDTNRPQSMDVTYIHGLLGASSYLYFGGDFLDELQQLCMYEGKKRTMFVNRARMRIYLENDELEYIDAAPVRLGMYLRMAGATPHTLRDYMYYYEVQQNTSSPYDGYLKRGQGFYEMDISMYLRSLANNPENTAKEVWLAPDLSPSILYTASQLALQNKFGDPNDPDYHKRIQIELSYSLLVSE